MFTLEELRYLIIALNAAAAMSRQGGHADQAGVFSALCEKVMNEAHRLETHFDGRTDLDPAPEDSPAPSEPPSWPFCSQCGGRMGRGPAFTPKCTACGHWC
jgi:hypothetical protein